jgi:Tol biopolymer transport system component/predicted Ser/Thr protein kinase
MIGQTLGHYEIIEKLGEGGMGIVYKAQDLHLDRPVALKVLPPDKMADPDRKQRFTQEAKAASALNHPNIITIHDITSEGGVDFIAMEYVAGKTLDQLIPRKGMRLTEALKVAVQVADALAAAHGVGIIHRDIKPSNVMVGAQGRVKVLDFGLVKLTGRDDSLASQETTAAAVQTDAGRIVGTVSYMSPEQAQGRPVDTRSDIFSFGALLYEMVSGQRPFQGESSLHTLAAILEKDPPPVAADVPREVQKVITRCVRKDPERRFQLMKDLRVELEELREESDSGTLASAGQAARLRFRRGWAVALAGATVVLAAAGWFLLVQSDRALPPPRVMPLTTYPGLAEYPALSPDGTQVAFQWNGEKEDNTDIYVKMVGDTEARRLTTDPLPDTAPCWSPDGKRLAFHRPGADGQTGILFLISPVAGREQKLAKLPTLLATGCSWSPDGKWLAVARGRPTQPSAEDETGIYLLPVAGGEPVRVTVPQVPATDSFPKFSWDGRFLAFQRTAGATPAGVFIQGLSPEGQLQGTPRQLATTGAYQLGLTWHRDGRSLIFAAGPPFMSHLSRAFLDGHTLPERLDVAGSNASQPTTSPQSDRLAFVQMNRNIDILRLHSGGATDRLITSSLQDFSPAYSPDGSRIAFTSNRSGETFEIWVADADGGGPVRLTHMPESMQGSANWSPDGKWIAFDSFDANGEEHIYVIESGGGQPRRITSEPSTDCIPSWSRDGQWIYFRSNRTGRNEIWRAPFAEGPGQQMTTEGGRFQDESTDGRTLFYQNATGELFAKPLAGGPERRLTGGVGGGANNVFVAVAQGIYYWGVRGDDGKCPIVFFDLASGKKTEMVRLAPSTWGLSVSPDRQSVLYAASVSTGYDLKVIEHFR